MAEQAAQPSNYLDVVAAGAPLFGMALQAHREGKIGRARSIYAELLDQPWLTAVCLHQLGIIAGQVGDHAKAVELLRRAIRLDDAQPMFHQNLAITLERMGKPAEALDALVNLAVTMQTGEKHADAIPIYQRVLQGDPLRYAAYVNMGTAQAVMGLTHDAVVNLMRGLALHARALSEARVLLGTLAPPLVRDGVIPAEAVEPKANPTGRVEKLEHALVSLGKMLSDLGYAELAVASYRTALMLSPGLPLAHWNLSLSLLSLGDFERGWSEYMWRWHWDRFPEVWRRLKAPAWRGEPIEGKRIGLFGEQGFGDVMQFSPLALKLAERAKEVVLEVPTPLVRLMRQSFEPRGVKIIARTDDPHRYESPIELDFVSPLMSLPHLLGLKRAQLPLYQGYLKPTQEDVDAWAERLAGLEGRKVGIVWGGRPAYVDDAKRSVALEKLKPLFEVAGISWVSLQLGPQLQQLGPSGLAMFDSSSHLKDFADTAGLVANLDLVLGVDTGVCHMAAGVGRPTWILLPRVPDWRWLLGRGDSEWYPSVRLFRQTAIGDWAAPIEEMRRALAEWGVPAPAPVALVSDIAARPATLHPPGPPAALPLPDNPSLN